MKHNEHKDKWAHRNKFSAESQIEIADTYILVLEIERKWLDERVSQLEKENAALSELLSPLVDVELERDKLKETIDALIAVYDLTQRDVENALKKWGGKEQDDETE